METPSTELKPWRSQFSHLIVERFQFLLWVTSKVETQTRCQAEHVTLSFLCLCLAGGSNMEKGEKPPLNHVLGPAEKSWIRGQTLSLTRKLYQTGSSVTSETMSPTSDQVLPKCRAVSHSFVFLLSPTSSSITDKHLKM